MSLHEPVESPLMGFYPEGGWKRAFARAPLTAWRLGWGPAMGWVWLVLTTRGRKSGLPRHALVEYHPLGDVIYVPSGFGEKSQWYRNLLADPVVTVQKADGVFTMRATPVDDPEEQDRAFRHIVRRYPPALRPYLEKIGLAAGSLDDPHLAEGLRLVRLEPEQGKGPEPLDTDLAWMSVLGGTTLAAVAAALIFRPRK